MLLTVSRIAVGGNIGNSENPPLPGSFPMLGHQNSPKKLQGSTGLGSRLAFIVIQVKHTCK